MKRVLMVFLPIAIIVAGGLGAWSMIENRPEPKTQTADTPPPLVRVQEVKPQSVLLTVSGEGAVAPRTESELSPEISGRVIWVSPSFAAGGFFEEQETLLKIDPREYELAVVRARAAVAQARLRLATEQQEAELARKEWEALGEGKPTPLTLREPQVAEARAALASAEAAVQQAEYDLERTVVRAPYAGRVREKKVDVGQFVTRGASVARIYAVDYAEVQVPIADDQLAFVDLPLAYRGQAMQAAGPKARLRARFGGREHEWTGRVVRTEGEVDPRSRMLKVVIQVDDPYGRGGVPGRPPLAVGMFVHAEIEGKRTPSVFVLPRSALRGDDQVLVADEENRLHFRTLEVLRAERDRVLVRSGLKAGERVCVSALETVVEGMEVRIADPKPAASGV